MTRQQAIDEAIRRVLAMGWYCGGDLVELAIRLAPLIRAECRKIMSGAAAANSVE